MKILVIHQNFPGQFKFLVPALMRRGHQLVVLTLKRVDSALWPGVRFAHYQVERSTTTGIHPWLIDLETKTIRGEACYRMALQLRDEGFSPDVILAHPGWGESLFLKDVWPQARLGMFCEFFYHADGADVGFDPEFPIDDPANVCRIRLKNINNMLHLQIADAGIAPTRWQADSFPSPFREKIRVIHDGIETDTLVPCPTVRLDMTTHAGVSLSLTRQDEVVTFVNRNLEPYRGYHIFMRALPELLKRRPNARVLIVGGDGASYGPKPDAKKYSATSWKEIFKNEVRPQIPDDAWNRIHYLGNLSYQHFIFLLQVSRVHVYLTYPFVLSWSLLEAMSVGCSIVASDTAPVREVIHHNQNGLLVDFFDVPGLTGSICRLLENRKLRAQLSSQARKSIQENYDLKKVCLPRQISWIENIHQGC